MKPYKYRLRKVAPPDYDYGHTVLRVGNQEVLNGVVQGMKASDLEERVAKALDKLEAEYEFRARITSAALGEQELTRQFENVRGEVEIDFLVDRGQVTPVFVDGQISHHFTPYQAEQDKAKTDITNEFGTRFGWREAVRIPFWTLIDQEMTDRTVRNLFNA
jgi:very-short-patch-repair endonuclease